MFKYVIIIWFFIPCRCEAEYELFSEMWFAATSPSFITTEYFMTDDENVFINNKLNETSTAKAPRPFTTLKSLNEPTELARTESKPLSSVNQTTIAKTKTVSNNNDNVSIENFLTTGTSIETSQKFLIFENSFIATPKSRKTLKSRFNKIVKQSHLAKTKTDENKIITTSADTSNFNDDSSTINPISTSDFKFECPEVDLPMNIGPYEVPTQRDFVLLIVDTTINLTNRYLQKAMTFLRDIKEATRIAKATENSCPSGKIQSYRKCTKLVNVRSAIITKKLVQSIEEKKQEMLAMLNGTICTMAEMKTYPIHFLEVLAAEEMSLNFALPGFLRLLNDCSSHCYRYEPPVVRKPQRKLSDQDIVVRFLLAQKNS